MPKAPPFLPIEARSPCLFYFAGEFRRFSVKSCEPSLRLAAFTHSSRRSEPLFRILLLSFLGSTPFLVAAPQPQPFRRPLVFEPNHGQVPAEVTWLARGPGYQLFFTGNGITMTIPESAFQSKFSTVRMKLDGSRPWNNVTGLEPTGGVSNYLRGRDAKNSLTHIPHYARMSVIGVYDGIDLVFYSHGGDLEYDFVVKPGADAKRIRLSVEGQDRIRVDNKSSDLLLTTEDGSELRQIRPKVYQQIGERRVEIAGGYQLLDHRRSTFTLAACDRSRPLVIDPTVSFTSFFGGSRADYAQAVAVDNDGNTYVTAVPTPKTFRSLTVQNG